MLLRLSLWLRAWNSSWNLEQHSAEHLHVVSGEEPKSTSFLCSFCFRSTQTQIEDGYFVCLLFFFRVMLGFVPCGLEELKSFFDKHRIIPDQFPSCGWISQRSSLVKIQSWCSHHHTWNNRVKFLVLSTSSLIFFFFFCFKVSKVLTFSPLVILYVAVSLLKSQFNGIFGIVHVVQEERFLADDDADLKKEIFCDQFSTLWHLDLSMTDENQMCLLLFQAYEASKAVVSLYLVSLCTTPSQKKKTHNSKTKTATFKHHKS